MIEYFIYSFCVSVPLLALYAAFMILTDRWKAQTFETDEDIDAFMNSSFFFNDQA